jgi:outer membrane protein TolC
MDSAQESAPSEGPCAQHSNRVKSTHRTRATLIAFLFFVASCSARACAQDVVIEQRPEEFDLAECIAVAQANQPAISVQLRAAQIAAEQVAIAKSFYMPQVIVQGRYSAIDEPRTVDINNIFSPQVASVFSDAAAYFQLARQAGTATADFALNNPQTPIFPNGPTFNGLAQQAAASLPTTINVGLLGENSIQSQVAGVQPLWTGGKIEAQVQRAQIGSRAANLDVVRTRQLTQYHVSQAYYSILLVLEQRRVVKDAEEHAKAVEQLVQSLLESGDEAVTSVDALRAATFRNLYFEQRVGFARLEERAYAALKLAMGFEQAVGVVIADRNLPYTAVSVSNEQVIAAALTNRPEVIQAQLGMNAAAWQHRAARAELLPDVVAFASLSTIYDDASFPNPNDNEEWNAGVARNCRSSSAVGELPRYARPNSGARRLAIATIKRGSSSCRKHRTPTWSTERCPSAWPRRLEQPGTPPRRSTTSSRNFAKDSFPTRKSTSILKTR